MITSEFQREVLASEGTHKSFFCSFDTSEVKILRELCWTWNSIPIQTYNFKSYENVFSEKGTPLQIDVSPDDRLPVHDHQMITSSQ